MKNIFLIFLITVNIQFSQNQFDYTDLFNAENNPEVSCYRIPSIITATNGDLIAAIDERVPSWDLKWSRDINIVIKRVLTMEKHGEKSKKLLIIL